MDDLQKVKTWSYNLGLLDIPLFEGLENDDRYVMLNGSAGNFCLDLKTESSSKEHDFRNYAWSSNVGHYIKLEKSKVRVYRWDKKSPEIYYKNSVLKNLEEFQDYLLNNQPRQDNSIINYIIRKFRELWNSFKDNNINGKDVLKSFLFLLACAKDKTSRENLRFKKWGLDETSKEIVFRIRKMDWEVLTNNLIDGDQSNNLNLKPELSLVLRHAAGRLFQEAHYQAIISPQLFLPGMIDNTISFKHKSDYIGIHYTPPFLARTLVEEALRVYGDKLPNPLTVFDPACGSGEFLKEILRQLEIKNYKGFVKLIGWDISESAIDICKFMKATESKTNIGFELKQYDAIDMNNKLPDNVDIVLMNPPFQSWELMEKNLREKVANVLGDLFQKKPSLASAFFFRMISCLKSDGIIASILPASIFDADSYLKLRDYLSNKIIPTLIARIGGHFIFSNATVHISMLVAKLSKNATINPVVFWSDYHSNSTILGLRQLRKYRYYDTKTAINEEHYSIYIDHQIVKTKDNWVPYSYNSKQIREKFKDFHKVKDIFEIRQGVRTGNPVFIISKNDYKDLPKSGQAFFRPAVLNESIKEGCLSDVAYLFYPYGKDISEIGDQEILLKKYVSKYYEEVLLPNKSKLKQRSRFENKSWWQLSEHRDWQIEKSPKLISTEFGKAGSFAWDSTGKFVSVRAHAWLLKERNIYFPEDVGFAYLAILSSQLINDLINSVSKQIGPTTWYLSSKYIYEMPLPNLFEIYERLGEDNTVIFDEYESDIFNELVIIGKNINNGNKIDYNRLNELTLLIYRVNPEDNLFLQKR